jgi:hypothetical protein
LSETRSIIRYRPTLPLSFIEEELGFDSSEECETFLRERGAVFIRKEGKNVTKPKIDTKASYTAFVNWEQNKNS